MNKYHNPYNTILELTGAQRQRRTQWSAKKVKQRINKTIKKKAAIKKNVYKESWKDKIIRKLKKLLKKRIKKSDPNMRTLIPETVDLIEMSKNKKSGNNNDENDEVVELWDVEEEEEKKVDDEKAPLRTKEEEDKVPDMQLKKTMKGFFDISHEELKEFREANKTKDKAKIMALYSKNLNKLMKDKDFKFEINNWTYQQGMNFADTEEGRINQLLGIPKFWEAHIDNLKTATKERKKEVKKLKYQIAKLEGGMLTEEEDRKLTDLKAKLVNEKRHIDENKIILHKHENAEYLRELFKDKLKGDEKPLNYYIHSVAGLKGANTKLRNKVAKISKHVKEKFNLWLDDLKKPLKDIAEKLKLSKSAEIIYDKLEKNSQIQPEKKSDNFLKSIFKGTQSWIQKLSQKEEKQIQKEVKNDMVEIEQIKNNYEEIILDLNRRVTDKNTLITDNDILIDEKNRFIANLERINTEQENANTMLNAEIWSLTAQLLNLEWTEPTQLKELTDKLNWIKNILVQKETEINNLETEFKNYEKEVAARKMWELTKW